MSSLVVYELAKEHRDTLVSGSRSVAVKSEWTTTVVNIASLNTVREGDITESRAKSLVSFTHILNTQKHHCAL